MDIDVAERIRRQNKQIEYRNILNQQVREKEHNRVYRRLQTQPITHHQPQYQVFSVNKKIANGQLDKNHPNNGKNKMVEQSVFLPVLDKNKNNKRSTHNNQYSLKHRRALSTDESGVLPGGIYTHETEPDTIEALTQCELIIENLRQLAHSSTNTLNKLQKWEKKLKNSRKKDTQKRTKAQRNNYNSINGEDRSATYLPAKGSEREVYNFRSIQPSMKTQRKQQKNKANHKSNHIQRESNLKNMKSNPLNVDDEDSIDSNEDHKQFEVYRKQGVSNMKRGKEKGKVRQYQEEDKDSLYQNQQERRTIEELRKERRKQKYLMKYLGKARVGGSKLHQKIVQFKNRMEAKSLENSNQSQPEQAHTTELRQYRFKYK